MKKIIVAIDGYSSCGKSTMAKVLAKTVGYIYVDTGAMYRVATLYAMRNNMIQEVEGQKKVDEPALNQAIEKGEIQVSFQLDPQTNLPLACLNGEVVENEIRTLEVSNNVSFVSALPFVREFLTQQQKNMGKKKGIVMDGRDIGTAVFPKAELKIFLTASPEVRAQRRYKELLEKGMEADYDSVLADIRERDYYDENKPISPLRPAADSVLIDTSELDFEHSVQLVVDTIQSRINIPR